MYEICRLGTVRDGVTKFILLFIAVVGGVDECKESRTERRLGELDVLNSNGPMSYGGK